MSNKLIPQGWRDTLARLQPLVGVLDGPFMSMFLGVAALSCLILYSAGNDFEGRFFGHIRNLGLATLIMWTVAHI